MNNVVRRREVPKREEDGAATESSDTHEPTSPHGHGIVRILPGLEGESGGDVAEGEGNAEEEKAEEGDGEENEDLEALVEAVHGGGVVAEGVQRGGRGHVEVVAPQRSEGVGGAD